MVYFVSDIHLGLNPDKFDVRTKEMQFVSWLKSLTDCSELYLLGDIFDFWYEYSYVVPKGFVRLFGQLASMSDAGIKIYLVAGNHDLWHYDYFSKELSIQVYTSDVTTSICGRKVLLSHGDALAGNMSFIGKIFRSNFLRWPFQRFFHPDLIMKFGHWWSLHNRMSKNISHSFKGENEPLVKAARKAIEKDSELDYIICGHIHTPEVYELNDKTKLFVLGQWVVGTPVVGCMDDDGVMSLVTL